MRRLLTLMIALVTAAPLACAARNNGFYVGAGAGRSSAGGALGSTTALQAFVGYDFNRFLGIETDYLSSGKMIAGGAPGSGSDSFSGAEASLLGKLPLLRRFALFGRVGFVYWHDDQTLATFNGPLNTFAATISQSGTSFAWGAGGEVSFGHLLVRGDFQQTSFDGLTFQLAGGSLIYRFY